ncbi:MAG TPA: hypothetical protein VNL17_09770 [Verrucomicrobiae bacterium]|nr:hypothetical protein [Verrucomicrobiae bacterium]
MDSDPPKQRFRHRQAEEQATEQQQTTGQQAGLAFESVEELLRYDNLQTVPPPAIAERLKISMEREPKPKRSWWHRLFGK